MHTKISPAAAFAAVVLLVMTLPLSGCFLADTKAVRGTQRFYDTYINSPVEVELDKPEHLGEADSRLVSRLIPVDTQLTALERYLNSITGTVDQNMMESMLRRFPWLSSVVVLSPNGETMAVAPPVPMKNLDYAPLLEPGPRSMPRDLRVSVQDTVLGPEVILARPFYSGQDLQVILAATFDFSTLMMGVEGAEQMMVRSPDMVLWSGGASADSTGGVNWAEELRHRSSGNVGGQAWLARYFEYLPLIFTAPGQ